MVRRRCRRPRRKRSISLERRRDGRAYVADGGSGLQVIDVSSCQRLLCPADANSSGEVDEDDLELVIDNWGQPGGAGDVNQDGTVDVQDLAAVILAWGVCP